jgi:ribosomal protein S18 acetylase RimI-like enzyme
VTIRPAMPHDWERVMAIMVEWWGGRDLRPLLPRIFFEHFRGTSLIVEHEDELVAFLVGFLCPTHDGEAYVHFVGVHPAWRKAGLGRDLYERFERIARLAGRDVIRAVTSPVNKASIAFHERLGFSLVAGDAEVDGVPVHLDQGWTDDGVVKFERRLTSDGARDQVDQAPAAQAGAAS